MEGNSEMLQTVLKFLKKSKHHRHKVHNAVKYKVDKLLIGQSFHKTN